MAGPEIYDYYILFPNHHEGLLLKRELKNAGVSCTISPTPRSASSFCGMSLLVTEEYLTAAKRIIENCRIKTDGIARIPRNKNTAGC